MVNSGIGGRPTWEFRGLESELLDYESLGDLDKKFAMLQLQGLLGDLGAELAAGQHKGIVFGWNSLAQLAGRYDQKGVAFRGQTQVWPLLPAIGRPGSRRHRDGGDRPHSEDAEIHALRAFQLRSRPYLSQQPNGDLEWLAIGRHHGLPTRLLDWTESFLVAAMFACINSGITDREHMTPEICAIRGLRRVDRPDLGPFVLKALHIYRPAHITPRIPAQQGIFTVHHEPDKPLDGSDGLERWLIWSGACFNIKKQLDVCGINESTLFPDMDGLGRYLGWCYKWGIPTE
jgi:hypothetical protein